MATSSDFVRADRQRKQGGWHQGDERSEIGNEIRQRRQQSQRESQRHSDRPEAQRGHHPDKRHVQALPDQPAGQRRADGPHDFRRHGRGIRARRDE